MREEPADRAPRHADRIKPLRSMSDPPVEPDVRQGKHERQGAEEKDTSGDDAQRHAPTTVVAV